MDNETKKQKTTCTDCGREAVLSANDLCDRCEMLARVNVQAPKRFTSKPPKNAFLHV